MIFGMLKNLENPILENHTRYCLQNRCLNFIAK